MSSKHSHTCTYLVFAVSQTPVRRLQKWVPERKHPAGVAEIRYSRKVTVRICNIRCSLDNVIMFYHITDDEYYRIIITQ